jgi:hypothetical protein
MIAEARKFGPQQFNFGKVADYGTDTIRVARREEIAAERQGFEMRLARQGLASANN